MRLPNVWAQSPWARSVVASSRKSGSSGNGRGSSHGKKSLSRVANDRPKGLIHPHHPCALGEYTP